jgi:uncharacterized spore protein YtfJ
VADGGDASTEGRTGGAGGTTPARRDLRIFDLLAHARDAVGVRRVFGDPIEVGGTTLVPAAWVAGGMGGGGGVVGPDDRHDASHGGGMGLGLYARPAGAYVVSQGSVEWKPAIDINQLVVVGITGVVAITWFVTRAVRRRR